MNTSNGTTTARPSSIVRSSVNPHGAWRFWCQYCGEYHLHGPVPGHRVAHSSDPKSPYKETGYYIEAERLMALSSQDSHGQKTHGYALSIRIRSDTAPQA